MGIILKIATLESLYRLKEKTFRAVDKNDLIFLKKLIEEKK